MHIYIYNRERERERERERGHRFITCLVAIWVVISQIWASITGNILSPFKWVFIDDDKDMPKMHKFVTYLLAQ